MSAITSIEVIAAGPRMPAVRFTDALPAVHTTVTFVLITTEDDRLGVGAVESDSFGSFDLGPLETLRSVVPALVGCDGLQPSAIAALAASRLPSASRHVPVSAIEVAKLGPDGAPRRPASPPAARRRAGRGRGVRVTRRSRPIPRPSSPFWPRSRHPATGPRSCTSRATRSPMSTR